MTDPVKRKLTTNCHKKIKYDLKNIHYLNNESLLKKNIKLLWFIFSYWKFNEASHTADNIKSCFIKLPLLSITIEYQSIQRHHFPQGRFNWHKQGRTAFIAFKIYTFIVSYRNKEVCKFKNYWKQLKLISVLSNYFEINQLS